MRVANRILHALGATEVRNVDGMDDPQTEADFAALDYVSPSPISWAEYQAKYEEILQKTALKLLRSERNRRIASTDWIMTVDNVETLANKADWIAYRQTLRDLPMNPPSFVWKGSDLDFSKMSMPVEPPVIRIS